MIYILRPFMNVKPVQTACLLLLFTSCKSLQRISSRDNSSNTTTISKKANPQFLDSVSITPGEKKGNDYRPVETSGKQSFEANSSSSSSFNIEKADWLQIKYAIIMDMPVEQLNNLP